ncbi:MAG TPA: hypothetical protein VGG53_11910 [Mycobacterium sp.]|uniref:hypothetical protein n=1 Tax=Mycobacterium sp. TaxID=1785 RepID=UPI002F4160A4
MTSPAPVPPEVAPPANYVVPEGYRAIPQDQSEPAPPVDFQTLHAPAPTAPVKPIAPPPRTVRFGDYTAPAPNFVPDNVLNGANTTAANAEAGFATACNSVGIDPSRSDKIAGGAIAGAAIGAAAAGIPAAVAGGVVGGVVGGIIGQVGWVGLVTGPPTIAAGAAIGAAVGAAAAGIPAAVVGGAVGGVVGGAVGSAI